MPQQNQCYKVNTCLQDLEILVPGSKSYATRLLILGSLAPDKFSISNCPDCRDVMNLEVVLGKIGLDLRREKTTVTILNSFPNCELPEPEMLFTGDGGTTNRFLIGMLGLGKSTYRLKMGSVIRHRPINEMLEILSTCGVTVQRSDDELKITGPYWDNLNYIEVDCAKTTQFFSSFKMAMYNKPITIASKNLVSSKKYLELTDSLITRVRNGEMNFVVPTDMSALSYAVAYSMLGYKVSVKNYIPDVLQADHKIISLGEYIGLKFRVSNNELNITPGKKYQSFEIDLNSCLDLAPTLSFMATLCSGTSRLKNLKQLRFKESDRLVEIIRLLEFFECNWNYFEDKDCLEIKHSEPIQNFIEYTAPNDHRMIMTSFLFMKRNAGGNIYNHNQIEKSWPAFFACMDP